MQSEVPSLMIDTIRFRGDFSDETLIPIVKFKLETLTKTKEDVTLYEFTTGQLQGSWDNRISISIKDMDWVYNVALSRPVFEPVQPYFICEMSLHKFFLGHNVYGFDDDLSKIHCVYDFLEDTFGFNFIVRDTVQLHRIDLAEVFKYDTKEEVLAIFHALKNHRRYRTKPSTYRNTGIYYPGTMTTFKVYDKHEEFKAHDFKKLKKHNLQHANEIYEISKNVVRFECEMHKRKLNEMYGRTVYVEDLILNKIIDLKNVYLAEKKRLIFEAHDDLALKTFDDVKQYMIDQLGLRKAAPLHSFWTDMVLQGEERTREIYPQASFYRNKKTLKEMGIPFYEYGFNNEQGQSFSNSNILRTVSFDDARRLKMVI